MGLFQIGPESSWLIPESAFEIAGKSYNVDVIVKGNSSKISLDQSPEYKLQNVKKYKGGHLKKKDAIKTMVSVAIKNAEWHGINIHHGTSNNADGNCIFESIIDNINSRPCFREFWSGSEDYLRKLWLEEAEVLVWNFCGLGMPEEILRKEWGYLKNGRTYECDLGDFVLHAVAHCVQKDILIFNTQISQSHEPISVVEASHLANRPANSDIPLTLAYNGVHYESLVPDTDVDIEKNHRTQKSVCQQCL